MPKNKNNNNNKKNEAKLENLLKNLDFYSNAV